MIIEKFFNSGTIRLTLENNDYYDLNENLETEIKDLKLDMDLIYKDMKANGLHFYANSNDMYLVDFNTQNAYDFTNCHMPMPVLEYLENQFIDKKVLTLYPIPTEKYELLMNPFNKVITGSKVSNKVSITIYKEDYSTLGWEILCKEFIDSIFPTQDILAIESITINNISKQDVQLYASKC